MAIKVDNPKHFSVFKLTTEEAANIGFGVPEGCICMHCNNIIPNNVYYISVLGDCMCEKCYNEWLITAKHYKSDREYELRNEKYIQTLLNQLEQGIIRKPEYPQIIQFMFK